MGLDVRMVDAQEACEIFPHLNKESILGGAYCPTDGTANPTKATLAYSWAAKRMGAKIYTSTKVTGLTIKNGRITGVETTQGKIEVRTVVNAAGPWAFEVGRMVGVDIPIRPKRNQVFVTQQLPAGSCSPTVTISGDFGWWAQTLHGNLLIGHRARPVDGFFRDATFEAISYQCYNTIRLCGKESSLVKAPVIRAFTGWTAWTPDEQLIMGFAENPASLFIMAAYCSRGFCLGPISGEIVAGTITGGTIRFPMEAFRFDRFEKANEGVSQ